MNDISYRQDMLARRIKISKNNLIEKKSTGFKHLENITLFLHII